MYLTEETPEAEEMREKIVLMLMGDEANVLLAWSLIAGGGFHFAFFPPLWLCFLEGKWKEAVSEDDFCDFLAKHLPPKVLEFTRAERNKRAHTWWRAKNALFEKVDFFELVVVEGLATLPQLRRMWEITPFLRTDSALTRFLLENRQQIDKQFFLNPNLPVECLRIKGIGFLFEDEDENFDKLAFLRRFLVGKTLDLHDTHLDKIPAEAAQLPHVEALNICGTAIKELPLGLLMRVGDIKANKRTNRKLYKQVFALNRFDYPYAQKLAYRKGRRLWEGKQYAEAMSYFQKTAHNAAVAFPAVPERAKFWEQYVDCLLHVSDTTAILPVLCQAFTSLPYPNALYLAYWEEIRLAFFLADKEAELIDLTTDYIQKNAPETAKNTGFEYDFLWRVLNEKLAYRNDFEGMFYLFEKARRYCPELTPQYWTWVKIFRHLRDHQQFADILKLLDYFKEKVFYQNGVPKQPIERHNRCVWIWIEAHIAAGEFQEAAALCQYYRHFAEEQLTHDDYRRRTGEHFLQLAERYEAQMREKTA